MTPQCTDYSNLCGKHLFVFIYSKKQNNGNSTRDPGYWVFSLSYLFDKKFKILTQVSATYIGCKYCANFALVTLRILWVLRPWEVLYETLFKELKDEMVMIDILIEELNSYWMKGVIHDWRRLSMKQLWPPAKSTAHQLKWSFTKQACKTQNYCCQVNCMPIKGSLHQNISKA